MSAPSNDDDPKTPDGEETPREKAVSNGGDSEEEEQEEEDEGESEDHDDADDEPKLKYTRLTSSLGPVYRNGDATSTFMVAGDKMVRRMLQSYPKSHDTC